MASFLKVQTSTWAKAGRGYVPAAAPGAASLRRRPAPIQYSSFSETSESPSESSDDSVFESQQGSGSKPAESAFKVPVTVPRKTARSVISRPVAETVSSAPPDEANPLTTSTQSVVPPEGNSEFQDAITGEVASSQMISQPPVDLELAYEGELDNFPLPEDPDQVLLELSQKPRSLPPSSPEEPVPVRKPVKKDARAKGKAARRVSAKAAATRSSSTFRGESSSSCCP